MGRAQKFKKQRKEEKLHKESMSEERRKIFIVTLVTVLVVVIGGYFLNNWYQNNKGDEIMDGSQVIMHTNMGDIKLAMYSEAAPKTVENFLGHAADGYYDGTKFHRVIQDFMIQGGDPLSKDDDPANDGTGGESIWGGKFADEINAESLGLDEEMIASYEAEGFVYNNSLMSYKMEPGVIAMANSGPDSNGSQFFIVTKEAQPHLDGRHTVFGKVIEGMDVVRAIAAVEVGESDRPVSDVVIESMEIVQNDAEDKAEPDMTVVSDPITYNKDGSIEIGNIEFE